MNLVVIAGTAFGLICAVIGYRRGFYSMWATTFNVVVSIYIAVMLTPTLSSQFGILGNGMGNEESEMFWYTYAAFAAGIAVLSFIILEVIALTYFTGIMNISLPKLVENVGSAGLGFFMGYIIWGFVCFVVLIMPFSKERWVTQIFTSGEAGKANRDKIAAPAITKLVNTTNAFSLQPNNKRVKTVVTWTLGWPEEDLQPEKAGNRNSGSDLPEESKIKI